MLRLENHSLKDYNTFGIDAKCTILYKINSVADLLTVLNTTNGPYFILGGGSNLLISKDQELTILKNEIRGIEIISRSLNEILVRVGGGENWHQFVMWALKNDFGGIENLSLIPGTVGASPIQNIGAYGVELNQVFQSLEAFNLETLQIEYFNNEDCQFGYRDSIFKHDKKGKYFITNVTFRLTHHHHNINISYGPVSEYLITKNIAIPKIQDVSDAIIDIRKSKLPDPDEIGNSGSFFKNPIISIELFQNLKVLFPSIPSYHVNENEVKIPAGWLIEASGWKGKRIGDAGCYKNQALVLVNFGNASGEDILNLANKIIADVFEMFKIELVPEVNII